ncbi:hypothetical protein [Sphaerisporangium sp. TRM90804]|uniref:hypothetical protein n=1 Tax=Sphaerisporangium sp. TRM90804 TaxID=3031113 RepID=UPI00244BDAD5|nr:hypothetical protein [Sphaerisporangium sp. TRM90804]MDH2424835.1 hypothetical protein [Sphaerisporangium sp. TRM90804]
MTEYGKWPRLIVAGQPVSREQANEILIRTDLWHMATNDRAWEQEINLLTEEFGRPAAYDWARDKERPRAFLEHLNAEDAWKSSFGVLELHYLHNEQIASAYIDGPHGWCDWDGKIGCASYNIGKWPTRAEVTEDLTVIAEAFPYLDMHVQLIHDEPDGEGDVADTWAVKNGVAALVEPAGVLDQPKDNVEAAVFGLLFNPIRERGVPLERLREALQQVRDNRPS